MLSSELRKYYLKRDVEGFEEMGRVLGRIKRDLCDVVRFDPIYNDEEIEDGGRGNPNMRWAGVCYSNSTRIDWHVHGNESNRALRIGLRYAGCINLIDASKIARVLEEMGFEEVDEKTYL